MLNTRDTWCSAVVTDIDLRSGRQRCRPRRGARKPDAEQLFSDDRAQPFGVRASLRRAGRGSRRLRRRRWPHLYLYNGLVQDSHSGTLATGLHCRGLSSRRCGRDVRTALPRSRPPPRWLQNGTIAMAATLPVTLGPDRSGLPSRTVITSRAAVGPASQRGFEHHLRRARRLQHSTRMELRSGAYRLAAEARGSERARRAGRAAVWERQAKRSRGALLFSMGGAWLPSPMRSASIWLRHSAPWRLDSAGVTPRGSGPTVQSSCDGSRARSRRDSRHRRSVVEPRLG